MEGYTVPQANAKYVTHLCHTAMSHVTHATSNTPAMDEPGLDEETGVQGGQVTCLRLLCYHGAEPLF